MTVYLVRRLIQALFVVLAIAVFGISSVSGYIWFAFVGAGLAAVVVYSVAALGREGATPIKLALSGAAVSAALAAVRLPGREPLILCEGVETALSIWQATGQETWACLGISNIGRAPVPENATVIIARDGDLPGSKAEGQMARAPQASSRIAA